MKCNKATGWDLLPSRLLKLGSDVLCLSICNLINMSFKLCSFSNMLKCAEVQFLRKALPLTLVIIDQLVCSLACQRYLNEKWFLNNPFILRIFLVSFCLVLEKTIVVKQF